MSWEVQQACQTIVKLSKLHDAWIHNAKSCSWTKSNCEAGWAAKATGGAAAATAEGTRGACSTQSHVGKGWKGTNRPIFIKDSGFTMIHPSPLISVYPSKFYNELQWCVRMRLVFTRDELILISWRSQAKCRLGTFLGFLGWSCRSCLRVMSVVLAIFAMCLPDLTTDRSQEAERQSTEIEGLRRSNLPSNWPCGLAVSTTKVDHLITSGGSAERNLVTWNVRIYRIYIPKGSDRLRKLKIRALSDTHTVGYFDAGLVCCVRCTLVWHWFGGI